MVTRRITAIAAAVIGAAALGLAAAAGTTHQVHLAGLPATAQS